MILALKASPNAKKSEILGWEDDPLAGRVLRIRLAAPPTEGKANKELIAFLSKALGLPKSALCLLKGESSRIKRLDIRGEKDSLLAQIECLKKDSSPTNS